MRRIAVVVIVAVGAALPALAAGPKPAESIGTTISRISEALAIPGCNGKLRLVMHSAWGRLGKPGCTYLRRGLGTFKSPHGAVYGTAAEIDAGTGYSQPATVVLALDHDRRFHIAFVQFE